MRKKLTEIISTLDRYNGFAENSYDYKGGAQVDICTDIAGAPDRATISESQQKLLNSILVEGTCVKKKVTKIMRENRFDSGHADKYADLIGRNVLSFEEFIKENYEIKPPRLSDADYDDRPKGWREDVWDEEDESENEEE